MNKLGSHRKGIHKQALFGILIWTTMILGGCATTEVAEQQNQADPHENINRKIYSFNDTVDNYVAEPIADAYKWITPQFVQTGVFNFFNNLKNINIVLNDVLQAKFKQSAQDTGRFAINSTIGLAGFVDVAKDVGLEQNDEDFEQTLAVWGVPQGSYLVLPLLGPSTVRGIPGAIFDTAANPSSYVGAPVQLVSLLNARANAEGALKFIDEAALDPYVFTRESFLQWRNHLATDGKSQAASDLTDFDDELSGNDKEDAAGAASLSGAGGKSTETENPKAGLILRLSADTREFEQVSHSFRSTAQSFDETAQSFKNAGTKIDKLRK
ncbi:MAG: VacJ family lipoprotein [Methylobacter sp.]|nr:VacJ family lipoprotein [Methylobacter sp.]